MHKDLNRSILQTLAYFNIFNLPLTKEELYRWLFFYKHNFKTDYIDFLEFLDEYTEDASWQTKGGYYFLPGCEKDIAKRETGIRLIEKKMKIARRAVRKLRYIPFVKAVFVCNTVAALSASEDSDIDVFIITKKNRLYLARIMVTLAMSIFRLRRTKKRIKDKICLSFYVSEDSLNLASIKIDDPDIYLMYWLDQLIPVYDPNDFLMNIFQKNSWAKKFLPHAFEEYNLSNRWRVDDNKISNAIKKLSEKIWQGSYGDMMEAQAKSMQQAKMKMNFMSVQGEEDSRVIINDKMLKFHENDRRAEYRERWLDSVAQ
ncbi:MAG: hypothetical protein GF349_01425 [Candidatus Magasanikbacteria bacterium]|nr:hypothetical protein [Candidatus Magasanikbacteria bacterium]